MLRLNGALLAALAALSLYSSRFIGAAAVHAQDGAERNTVASSEQKLTPFPALKIPGHQSYAGAYIDFGLHEDHVTMAAIRNFDRLAGRKQALIGFSSDWGARNFPAAQVSVIGSYGAIPVIYWSPWDRPVGAPEARKRFELEKILSGEYDDYIEMWALAAKKHAAPMLVCWGLEMNGQWFPWSGFFHGAGTLLEEGGPGKYEGPEKFKETYRYVVDRVRRAGALNIQWVFHANNTSDPDKPWNVMSNYYPGPDYVDWLGMSAYGQQYPDQGWVTFETVLLEPYRKLTALDPVKPVILAEWGIGEFPTGSKAEWLKEAFQRLPVEFPRIKAAVYWHERWMNGDKRYSNLRINSSPQALAAYKKGIANSYWLDRPLIEQ